MSSARSSCNMWAIARQKPLASRCRSICDCRRSCGTGDCRVHTQSMRTGYLPAHTAAENCVLARFALQGALGTGVERNRNRGPFRLAHVPAYVRDAPQGERRGREGCARADAARKHLGHPEHLRASDHANQARCTEPSCESVARQKRRKTKHRGLSDVNGRTKFWRGCASG